MISVLIVIAILIILAAALINSAAIGFKNSKHEETADIAYFAAQSGLEKCFSFIDNYCSIKSNSDGISYTSDADFAQQYVEVKLKKALKEYTSRNYGSPADKAIFTVSLSDKSSDTATVEIIDDEFRFLSCKDSEEDPGKIDVTIGVKAVADYKLGENSAVNKGIYAKKVIKVYIPRGFQLDAAIYTIGDLMINNINAQVTGDVVAFGTSPKYAKQVEQYYYGGIYAKNRGHLSVYGNAYSRGLIRTGEYSETPDPSSIYIYKDAIANGIHIFGKGQQIVVGRNAFTFDDIELNGEDSVIAVNGSYLGLSNENQARYHDQSSAIINSAIVHHSGSPDSLKSRIVINGDAVVNGGTFRIDPGTGKVDTQIPQIEDASVITRDSTNWPMYKDFLDGRANGSITETNYHTWLFNYRNSALGFSNLIQCWTPRRLSGDSDIKEWLSLINAARGIGINNPDYFDSGIDIDSISGFCHYELGANDRVYFMNKGLYQITKFKYLNNGQFMLDNIKEKPTLSDWTDFWAGLPESVSDWRNLSSYDSPIANKLLMLKNMLVPKTEVFAQREYIYSDSDKSIINNTFKNAPGSSSSGTLFLHIKDWLNTNYPALVRANPIYSETDPDRYVFNLDMELSGQTININDKIEDRLFYNPTLTDKYFLVINPDPSITIEIDRPLNGIIFSMGKVILREGADVRGAILAAGKGFTPDSSRNYVLNDMSSADQEVDAFTGKITNYMPQILENGENLSKLDNGSYAGVYFVGTGTGDTARVTFPGRDNLLEIFKEQGMGNLYRIFDF